MSTPLIIVQGLTWKRTGTITNPDGTPYDLSTQKRVKMSIKRDRSANSPDLITLDSAGSNPMITFTDPTNGKVQFKVPYTSTQTLNFSNGVYDVVVIDESVTPNEAYPVEWGPVQLIPAITQVP